MRGDQKFELGVFQVWLLSDNVCYGNRFSSAGMQQCCHEWLTGSSVVCSLGQGQLWGQGTQLVGGEENVAAKLNQAGVKTTVLCQELECHNDRTDAVTNSCGLSVVQMRHSASL